MTVDEAICQLNDLASDSMFPKNQEDIYALNLGIEALKRLKINRVNNTFYVHGLLPGETKG